MQDTVAALTAKEDARLWKKVFWLACPLTFLAIRANVRNSSKFGAYLRNIYS